MMKDQKESFIDRNPSVERPTVDKGQNSQMINWDGLFENNQAADWERLFDMIDTAQSPKFGLCQCYF